MALTINQQFTRFVEFASARNDANNQNTIARLGRNIKLLHPGQWRRGNRR